mgnify:CR=1 FL=1
MMLKSLVIVIALAMAIKCQTTTTTAAATTTVASETTTTAATTVKVDTTTAAPKVASAKWTVLHPEKLTDKTYLIGYNSSMAIFCNGEGVLVTDDKGVSITKQEASFKIYRDAELVADSTSSVDSEDYYLFIRTYSPVKHSAIFIVRNVTDKDLTTYKCLYTDASATEVSDSIEFKEDPTSLGVRKNIQNLCKTLKQDVSVTGTKASNAARRLSTVPFYTLFVSLVTAKYFF